MIAESGNGHPHNDEPADEMTASQKSSPRAPLPGKFMLMGVALGFGLFLVVAALLVWKYRDPLPPMTAADLAAAEQRWQEHGFESYDLDVEVGGNQSGAYHVQVRNGKVSEPPTRNGQPIAAQHTWNTWTVAGQFDTIRRELELAADPQGEMKAGANTRLLLGAEFHPKLGYPVRFRRLVQGAGPEVTWQTIRLTPAP